MKEEENMTTILGLLEQPFPDGKYHSKQETDCGKENFNPITSLHHPKKKLDMLEKRCSNLELIPDRIITHLTVIVDMGGV